VLGWEPGFEEFLRERKKGRKVASGETILSVLSFNSIVDHMRG